MRGPRSVVIHVRRDRRRPCRHGAGPGRCGKNEPLDCRILRRGQAVHGIRARCQGPARGARQGLRLREPRVAGTEHAGLEVRLGSITKQFTAASILLLEERRKIRLTDPVKVYLPDAPAAWDHITIYNLLTHTSGIPDFTSFPDYIPTQREPTTPAQLVARFRNKPLDFPPGTSWMYSNSGYEVLGYLIEKISGMRYKDFVKQNLLRPQGMNESGYDTADAVIPHRASGYTPDSDGPVNAAYLDMSIPYAAGGLYSTTHDLWRWERALFGGRVLSASSLKAMTTPFKNDYALGLAVHTVDGQTVIEHGGGINGFNTVLAYYPADTWTVVVLANLNGSAPDEIARDLAKVAIARPSCSRGSARRCRSHPQSSRATSEPTGSRTST